VETALQIEQSVSRYLFTITLINVGQGVAVGTAMWLIGLPSPALWGAMACVLTFIPFIGATIGLAVVFLVALMEFETAAQALWAPALYALIGTIQGQLITPTVLGRRMSLNPVMVLLSLIFWGWMWGIGGAILAVPILAIVTATCCNIERLKPLGEFLSAPPRPS
jgi:predicted PurR-regulated permease PerM